MLCLMFSGIEVFDPFKTLFDVFRSTPIGLICMMCHSPSILSQHGNIIKRAAIRIAEKDYDL